MMDDNIYTGEFASEYNEVGADHIEQSVTKRLLAPGRRPGGPRQAFRPVQIYPQHVRNNITFNLDDAADAGVVSSKPFRINATEMDIDPSCLDALDDQLLASPIDSFMDVCWAEAVGEHDSHLGDDSPTLYNARICAPQVSDHKKLDNCYDLDPLDSDNEKHNGDESVPVTAYIKYEHEAQDPPDEPPLPRTGRGHPSLAFWEPHFRIPNPNDTVHGFPSRPAKSRRWRKMDVITNACSRFPGRLVKSAS